MLFLSKVFYIQAKTSNKCVAYQKHATVRNNKAQISQNKELSQVVNWTAHITLQHITLQQTLFLTLFQSSTLANITTVITRQVKWTFQFDTVAWKASLLWEWKKSILQ
jgi:hypothetical protein